MPHDGKDNIVPTSSSLLPSLVSSTANSQPLSSQTLSSQTCKSSPNDPTSSGPGRPVATPASSSSSSQSIHDNHKCDETQTAFSAPPSTSVAIAAADPTCVAARCRPVKSYRRRKLLQMSGLHNVSRKAARPVTLSCSCWPPSATHRGGHDYRCALRKESTWWF